ncbi:MAG: type VI secretion system tip protein VgrG [Xanthomonadaceae bacterium]|jgi:type VI secretion system secreted protein VgrG|nr:type VI secretion system tip protein VgrG [Xanthomonadaceae bacterium]
MYGEMISASVNLMRFQQDHRLIRIKTVLYPEPFVVKSFFAHEFVSAPFVYTVDMLSPDTRLELKQLIGQPARLSLAMQSGDRYFHGYVREFARIGSDGDFATYRAEIAPWFAFLQYTSNCRIFQDKTVLEIIDDVFASYAELADYQHDLNAGNFPKLPYCVQYNESDFDFVSRLLEDAGIYYAFEHGENGHTMVLADNSPHASPIGQAATIRFKLDEGAQLEHGLDTWAARRRISTDVHTLKSFDFKQPRSSLASDHALAIPHGMLPKLERYHYDGAARFLDTRIGDVLAGVRGEESAWPTKLFEGAGVSRHVHAGGYFVLEGHYDHAEPEAAEREFFVTQVQHEANNNFTSDFAGAAPAEYRCTLTALRRKIPYRPLRITPRRIMPGPQTATVVGPPGEEVYADRYGRVKVQFHWDRLGQFNDGSSCWIRVASPWAGSDMGGVSPPRIGQEVIVDFLDGDPDRPLIINRVFNEDNMPPFGLEVSGLRSKTVKGEGFNEITMHDTAGSELLNMRAQHNMATAVGNNQTASIAANKSTDVGGDYDLSVIGSQAISVGCERAINVTGSDSLSVAGDGSSNIAGAYTAVVIGAVSKSYEAGETKSICAGGYLEDIIGDLTTALTGHYTSTRDGTWTETITGAAAWQVDGLATETLGAGRDVSIVGSDIRNVQGNIEDNNQGTRDISVDGAMTQSVSETCSIASTGEMTLESAAKVTAKVGEASLVIESGAITITVGGSEIVIDGGGVSINGGKIRLN